MNLVWIPHFTSHVGIFTFMRIANYSWGFLIRTVMVCALVLNEMG